METGKARAAQMSYIPIESRCVQARGATLSQQSPALKRSLVSQMFEETRISPRPKLPIQENRSALLFREAQMQSCSSSGIPPVD